MFLKPKKKFYTTGIAPYYKAAGGGGGGTLTFVATDTTQLWQTNNGTFTFAATIGTASTDRIVVVAVSNAAITNNNITGVTVGGLAMTKALTSGVSGGFGPGSEIWYRLTPTSDIAGSTASIVVSSAFSSDVVISVGKITGSATATLGPTAFNSPNISADPHTFSAAVPTNGVAVLVASVDRPATPSWTGATSDSLITEPSGNTFTHAMAHGTSSTPSFTGANTWGNSSAMATFGP